MGLVAKEKASTLVCLALNVNVPTYHNPEKRSITNAIQIFFTNGSSTDKIEVEYPLGHRFCRDEGIPILIEKFKKDVYTRFPRKHGQEIIDLSLYQEVLLESPVNEFMNLLVI